MTYTWNCSKIREDSWTIQRSGEKNSRIIVPFSYCKKQAHAIKACTMAHGAWMLKHKRKVSCLMRRRILPSTNFGSMFHVKKIQRMAIPGSCHVFASARTNLTRVRAKVKVRARISSLVLPGRADRLVSNPSNRDFQASAALMPSTRTMK